MTEKLFSLLLAKPYGRAILGLNSPKFRAEKFDKNKKHPSLNEDLVCKYANAGQIE